MRANQGDRWFGASMPLAKFGIVQQTQKTPKTNIASKKKKEWKGIVEWNDGNTAIKWQLAQPQTETDIFSITVSMLVFF